MARAKKSLADKDRVYILSCVAKIFVYRNLGKPETAQIYAGLLVDRLKQMNLLDKLFERGH